MKETVPELRPLIFRDIRTRRRLSGQNKEVQTTLCIPDIHVGYRRNGKKLEPFHDEQAVNLAWNIAADLKPDNIVLLGDNLDLCDWSMRFARTAECVNLTQESAVTLAGLLANLRRENPSANITYIEGNHENRIQRLINGQMLPAAGLKPVDDLNGPDLLSVERLLGLASLGINFLAPYPDGQYWVNENLVLTHGLVYRSAIGATTRFLSQSARTSTGFGHIHRLEMNTSTSWSHDGAKTYMSFSPGTLAKIGPGGPPAHHSRNNWQQGIAFIEHQQGNGLFHVDLLPFTNGKTLYRGKLYKG